MPDEITTSEAEATSETKEVKFKLEKIDADNVKKIDSWPDVTVINIPAIQKEKGEIEAAIGKLQTQLDQINEVLAEYAKLP
jgi:hypothetical protein